MAGLGVYKGSRDAGDAAKRLSQGATNDLHTLTVFLTEKAWPDVNKTLIRAQQVMDSADTFFKISMLIIALLCSIGAAYVASLLHANVLSKRKKGLAWWNKLWRKSNNYMYFIEHVEDMVIFFLYCLNWDLL